MPGKAMPVISIVGPTASGKTELSIRLARKFNGEIISADSMQIYKEFKILTAKPTIFQMQTVQHHMVDIISVSEEFSVAKFSQLTHECIKNIFFRGNVPFIVGGTGLYVDSILKNIEFEKNHFLSSLNKKNLNISTLENGELMDILQKVDPISSEKIHINDRKRLKRAIEFFYASGYPISEQAKRTQYSISPYNACKIGLDFKDREVLYQKINSRIDQMFERGLVEEVKNLTNEKLGKTAAAAIGFKEVLPYIRGEQSREEAAENLKRATRRYAKRQLTWFRRDGEINWIYGDECENFSSVLSKAEGTIENFYKGIKK